MKLTRAARAALILAAHAKAATAADSVENVDARIADAKQAAIATGKAADVICENAGYAMGQRDLGSHNSANKQFKQCMDAMQASSDAIGFVGYLYEQRSRLTGQPMPREYACNGKPSLGAPHRDPMGHVVSKMMRQSHDP